MKKIIVLGLMLAGVWQSVQADICYDIVNDQVFSEPESSNINPYKYEECMLDLGESCLPYLEPLLNSKMSDIERGKEISLIYTYVEDYLIHIGSPEALRLCKDIEKVLINLADSIKKNPDLWKILNQNPKNVRLDHFGIKYKV